MSCNSHDQLLIIREKKTGQGTKRKVFSVVRLPPLAWFVKDDGMVSFELRSNETSQDNHPYEELNRDDSTGEDK
jgi:hypothetical protein